MTLPEKITAVNDLFEQLDKHIADFQSVTGLKCASGCGKCCFKPDIEATVLEFLPLADHLFKNSEAERWLENIANEKFVLCSVLDPLKSGDMCTQYPQRGLICRLFGFSARKNKMGIQEMFTCQIIKSDSAGRYAEVAKSVASGIDVPLTAAYYQQLCNIDFDLGREFYPINTAIRKAIEMVLTYYSYHTLRSA